MDADVLQLLALAVRAFPELRVGQLIYNAVYQYTGNGDAFNVTNDKLGEALIEYMRRHKRM